MKHRHSLFAIRGTLAPAADLSVGLFGLIVVLVIWCFLTYGGAIKPLFLPSPTRIWEGLISFQQKGWLLTAVLNSTVRVTKSLILVTIIGVPIGILMGTYAPVDALLRKIVNGAKSVPTTGLVGLVVLWFSIEERAKIIFLFLGAIFYMIILVKNAVGSVSEDFVKVTLDLGATRWQTIRKVILPAALPQIWDAIAVCNGIMWTYIVLAEYINSSQEQLGLGYLLSIGARTQESGMVFATLIVIALISTTTDWIFQSIRKVYLAW